jgi:integrase
MRTHNAVEAFLESRRAKNLSPETIRGYNCVLRRFTNEHLRLPKKPEQLEAFWGQIPGDERRHYYYRVLKAFYNFGEKRLKMKNLIRQTEAPQILDKVPAFLVPDQLSQLLSFPHPQRIRAALMFLVSTGCRVKSCALLQPEDLLETPWGYIAKIKGKRGEKIIPVDFEAYSEMLKVAPLNLSPHRLSKLLTQAFRDALVPGTAHALRHTMGTLWDGDIYALKEQLGHASIVTTLRYRHLQIKRLCLNHRENSPLRGILTVPRSML